MFILGLTGSIGMGKSVAANQFKASGVPVFDADQAVHDLYAGAAVAPVGEAFPGVVDNGRINRTELSRVLLEQPHRFSELEAIVHPLVRKMQREFLAQHDQAGQRLVVLEIPLLFESGLDRVIDAVAVVSAPYAAQRERVLQREGMTSQKFEEILRRQMPDEEKRTKADFVVDTGGAIEQTQQQINTLVELLRARKGEAFQKHWL